jgi:hypothetical protein
MIVVHVTHEAAEKIGGIGAVIAGLTTAEAYGKSVSRTILLGPLLTTDRPVNRRLGEGGNVLYSSLDAILTPPWHEKFRPIETTYDVGIVYGTRKIVDPCGGNPAKVEVLLVDVFHANRDRLNLFKAELWKKFAVPSHQFEKIWEYEQYIRLAEPGFEALKAIGANGGEQVILLAHEYMGMPTALKAILAGSPNTRTVFYAHEVASVRPIVEHSPGHDTMFYNALRAAADAGQTIEQNWPEVLDNYKHPLVRAARYCDHIFAVGDYTAEELRVLEPHFQTMDIDLVYNGIQSLPLTLNQKQVSRQRMRTYASNLLGLRPTWIFTHVCRPVLSKALWRDLAVLHELEPMLRQRGETAVYFMLGTLAGQRRSQDVRHMERVYGWPVNHDRGYPDLCGGEEVLGDTMMVFDRGHTAIHTVLVNQWDWNRLVLGERAPEDMTFADIRVGTDVEFGLSNYEPFGISQFEALGFGAICVPSNVCGCMGFARRVAETMPLDGNIIEGNFLTLPDAMTAADARNITWDQRNAIEQAEARRLAGLIFEALPRDEKSLKRLMDSGYQLARCMSWERVVEDYFLPSLSRTAES